jgi:hypothetical protein
VKCWMEHWHYDMGEPWKHAKVKKSETKSLNNFIL